MSVREFSTSLTVILGTMAIAALIEWGAPLFARTPDQRTRHVPNLGLTALVLLLNWALTSASAVVALALSLQGPGWFQRLGLPALVELLVSVAVLDFFFGYAAHRAMHVWPRLWRIHRVHHSDPFVDVTTAYRTHPIEVAWRFLFMTVPIWTLGIPAQAVAAYRLLSAINAAFEHANLRLRTSLDSAVSTVWVTPNMHKVHHSRDPVETDTNFGNILSVYDRVLRTFTPSERALTVVYGLDDAPRAGEMPLGALLTLPFRSTGESHAIGKPGEVPA
jgi:sterol desaturase/sphingolipid hydroxylase (fatty acid hydroxylase superfamily)